MYAIKVTQQDENSPSFINQNNPRKFYITEEDKGVSRENSIKRDLFITYL